MKKTIQIKKSNQSDNKENKPVHFSSFWSLPSYLIFAFAFILYANSLFNQYTLDDRLMITDNKFTKKGVDGVWDILTTDSFVGFFGVQKIIKETIEILLWAKPCNWKPSSRIWPWKIIYRLRRSFKTTCWNVYWRGLRFPATGTDLFSKEAC